MHLDIDAKSPPESLASADAVVARCLNVVQATCTPCRCRCSAVVTRIFAEDYRVELKESDLVWTYSPNQTKLSLHLVISTHSPQLVFRSNHKSDPQGA